MTSGEVQGQIWSLLLRDAEASFAKNEHSVALMNDFLKEMLKFDAVPESASLDDFERLSFLL